MKLDYEISDFTLRNLLGQFNAIFGPDNIGITYSVMDADGNTSTVDVDSWKKIKSEVRTDLEPLANINAMLLNYISFTDNIATISGTIDETKIGDNKLVLGKDTKGIYTKNQYGGMVKSLDSGTIADEFLKLLKNGEQIIFGNGIPLNTVGTDDALYIDIGGRNILYKKNGSWVSIIVVMNKTETPIVSGVTDILELDTKTFNITNFDNTITYDVYVTSGEATVNINDGTITYIAGSVNSDYSARLEITGIKEGLLRSEVGVYNFTVNNIPTDVDDAIIDNAFSSNADISTGIQF